MRAMILHIAIFACLLALSCPSRAQSCPPRAVARVVSAGAIAQSGTTTTEEAQADKLRIWINAFIPEEVYAADGKTPVTLRVPDGPHKGKTMLLGPSETFSDCFLTDQRSFDQDPSAKSRMHSMVTIDLRERSVSDAPRCDTTFEVDCEDGDVEDTGTSSTKRISVNEVTVDEVAWGTRYSFVMDAAARNPCHPSPDLEWEIRVVVFVSHDRSNIWVSVWGRIDEFPAFEMYAKAGEGPVQTVFQLAPEPGKTPADLFGDAPVWVERDIKLASAAPSQEMTIWLNAFIPKEVLRADGSLYTRTLGVKPFEGMTAIPPPIPELNCYLTDQREFSDDIDAPSRMHARAVIDLATGRLVDGLARCNQTTSLDCDSGAVSCRDRAPTRAIVMGESVRRVGFGRIIELVFDAQSSIPCLPTSTDIGWEVRARVEVPDDRSLIKVSAEGVVSEFPAFEMYASCNGMGTQRVIGRHPTNGRTPFHQDGGVVPVEGAVEFRAETRDVDPLLLQDTGALRQRFVDIDSWRMDHLKRGGWELLSAWLSEHVQDSDGLGEGAQAVSEAISDRDFRAIVPSDYGPKFLDTIDEMQALAFDGAAKPSGLLELKQSGLEAMLVFHTVSRWLGSTRYRARLLEACMVANAENRTAAITALIEESLRDEQRVRRQLAKARELVSQDDRVLALLGVDRTELDALLRIVDPAGDHPIEHDAARAGDDARIGALLAPPLSRTRLESIDALQVLLVRVRWACEQLGPQLDLLREYYQRLFETRYIDLRPNGIDPSAPFLRVRLSEAKGGAWDGYDTRLTGEIVACQLKESAHVEAETTGGERTRATALDEVPLGIAVFGLSVDFDPAGTPRARLAELAPRQSRFRVDKGRMLAALRHMGLPEQIDVDLSSFDVNVESLDRIVADVQLRVPSFDSIGFDTSGLSTRVRFVLGSDGFHADAGFERGSFESVIASSVGALQKRFDEALEREVSAGRGVSVVAVHPSADNSWAKGRFAYTAHLALSSLRLPGASEPFLNADPPITWSVDVRCVRKSGRWQFELSPHRPPGEMLDLLRDRLATQWLGGCLASIDRARRDAVEGLVNDYVRLEDVSWSPDPASFEAVLRLTIEWPAPAQGGPPIRFDERVSVSIDIGSGDVRVDLDDLRTLRDRLGDVFDHFVDALIQRVRGRAVEEIADLLRGQSLQVAGITGTIETSVWEEQRDRIRLGVLLQAGSLEARLRDIRFIAPDYTPNSGFKPGDFDFSDAKIEPSLQRLAAESLGIDTQWLRISGERSLPDGVEFDLGIEIEALATPIHLGRATLAVGGSRFEAALDGGLAGVLASQIQAFFDQNPVQFDEIGPMRDVEFNVKQRPQSRLAGLAVVVSGHVKLPEPFDVIDVKVSMDVLPEPSTPDVEPKIGGPANALMKEYIGAVDFGGFKFSPRIKDTKPYGIIVGIKGSMFKTVTVSVEDVEVTTDGIEMPGKVAADLPGTYPIGNTGLVIVNPGFELVLGHAQRDPPGFWLTGDITVLSEGLERVAKVDGRAGSDFDSTDGLVIEVKGTTVLVSVLPVFENTGSIHVQKAEARWDSRSVGLMSRILSTRGETIVRGKEGLIRQDGGLKVLGLEVADAQVSILVPKSLVSARGEVSLPISELILEIEASPDLRRMKGEGRFDVNVFGWEITGANLSIEPSLAEMKFGLLGFSLRVITPGPLSITPALVHRAIMEIFDFNFSLKSLLNREIVVSLVPPGDGDPAASRPPGHGDPVPDGGPPSDDNMAPSEPPPGGEGPPPGTTESPREQYSGAESSSNPLPRAKNDGREVFPRDAPPESEPPTGGVDSQVITYKPGNVGITYERDPDGERRLGRSLLFKEVITTGTSSYWSHMSISDASCAHVTGTDGHPMSMIIDSFDAIDPADKPLSDTCRNGYVHTSLPYYVTLNADGDLYVVGMYSRGKAIGLPKAASSQLLGQSKAPNLFEHLKDPKHRLQPGDIALLRGYAMDALFDAYGSFKSLRALTAGQDLTIEDGVVLRRPAGYVCQRTDPKGVKSLTFLSRDGAEVEIDEEGESAKLLGLSGSTLRADKKLPARVGMAITLLVGARSAGFGLGLLAGEGGVGVFLLDPPGPAKWVLVLDGEKVLKLDATDWSGSHRDLGSAYFPKGSAFHDAFLPRARGSWNRVRYFKDGNRHHRMALTVDIDKNSWACVILYEDEPGLFTRGKLDGASVEDAYAAWMDDALVHGAPHPALTTAAARLWLIEQVLSSGDGWQGVWVTNPLILIRQIEEHN